MKKVLLLFAAMFILAFGTAYASDMPSWSEYTSDKMLRDDDLPKYEHNQDQGQGTFKQVPALPEAQGSAAGGSSGDNTYGKQSPAEEKDTTKSDDSGGGMEGPSYHY